MTININDVNDAPSFLDEWRDENYELISDQILQSLKITMRFKTSEKFSPYDEDGDPDDFRISGDELMFLDMT